MTPIYVLLLTFFLQGGPTATTSIVAHSLLDCQQGLPLIVKGSPKTVNLAGHDYKVTHVDAQCVRVPADTSV